MRVRSIHRYPVKGLPGEDLPAVALAVGEAVPGDRRFAFAVERSKFDAGAPDWFPKRHFANLMLHARLARVRSSYDAGSGVLDLSAEGHEAVSADLGTAGGRAAAGDWMTRFMAGTGEGAMRLAEAPGEAFADIRRKAVHIVGAESVEALGREMGVALDMRRFRANVVLDGVPAYAELGWEGREIRVGGVVLRVFGRTGRCANTEVNPDTAERDAAPQTWLRERHGHGDMGVYAEVVGAGEVRVGDMASVSAG